MFRYKSNKQALVVAVLVILLCLACLSGATLALFTSDINDGKIGIVTTTGDVEVDIVDADDVSRSLVGDTLDFKDASVTFEPGATFCTKGFKVINKGNVNIRFRVSVSADEEMDMRGFNDAFTVWITTDPSGDGDTQLLTEFTGTILPGAFTEDTYYICIKMKESAGNEFKGQTYNGIGITVYAIQGNVEV
ncbi:MAG: hypothetical protein IKB38_07505 [Clostridia bacterium]|nr:hypothetical protein [Clostridia bacterium]